MRSTQVALASFLCWQAAACQPPPDPASAPAVAAEPAPAQSDLEVPPALQLDCSSRALEAEVLGTIEVSESRVAFSRDLVVHGNQLHVIAGYHEDPCGVSNVYRAELAPWRLQKLAFDELDPVHLVFGLHVDADHLVWGESPGCGEVQRIHRMPRTAAPATTVDRPIGYAPFLAHEGWLHWTNDRGALMRLSFANGADELLGSTPAPSAPRLRAVFAVDQSGIYAAETGPPSSAEERGHLVHVPLGGGSPQRLVPLLPTSTVYSLATSSDQALLLAGRHLGEAALSHLLIVSRTGGRAMVRTFSGHIGKPVIAGGHAYAIVSFPIEGGRIPSPAAALVKVPLDGAPTELLGCSNDRLSALAIDGDQLYFTADPFRGGTVTVSRRPR